MNWRIETTCLIDQYWPVASHLEYTQYRHESKPDHDGFQQDVSRLGEKGSVWKKKSRMRQFRGDICWRRLLLCRRRRRRGRWRWRLRQAKTKTNTKYKKWAVTSSVCAVTLSVCASALLAHLGRRAESPINPEEFFMIDFLLLSALCYTYSLFRFASKLTR